MLQIFSNIATDEQSPSVSETGILGCRLFTLDSLFTKDLSGTYVMSQYNIERYCDFWKDDRSIAVLDIEHWPMTGTDDQLKNTARLCAEVIREVRKHQPWRAIGLYSFMPVANWFAPLAYETFRNRKTHSWYPTAMKNYKWWLGQSRFWTKRKIGTSYKRKRLTDYLNFIAPDIYAVTDKIDDWKRVAHRMMIEARKHMKPVYPYISPYIQGKTIPLPDTHLIEQIKFLESRGADGVIIYTYPKLKEEMGWWVNLRNFVASSN